MIRALFEWVDAMPNSVAWRESLNAYVYLLTIHVVSMGLVAGIISYWDMRLAGIALKWIPVSKVKSALFPWLYGGVLVNAGTGLMMLYSQPMRYYPNFWFWFKMGMLVMLAVNAAYFHLSIEKTVEDWEHDPVAPLKARKRAREKAGNDYDGRDPGPAFQTMAYYRANPDIARAGWPALSHYLMYGRAAGRATGVSPERS